LAGPESDAATLLKAASRTAAKKFLQELRWLAPLIHATLPNFPSYVLRNITRRSLRSVKTDYPDRIVVLAFQQVVDDTFDSVFDRRNSPRGWRRYGAFARSRAEITLHDEHWGFLPVMMLALATARKTFGVPRQRAVAGSSRASRDEAKEQNQEKEAHHQKCASVAHVPSLPYLSIDRSKFSNLSRARPAVSKGRRLGRGRAGHA
jgi:hypothetical protein